MENKKVIPTHNVEFSGTVEDQALHHAEAHRRLNEIAGGPTDTATGLPTRTMDSWSSGGQMNGVMTPDLQGPEPLAPGVGVVVPVSSGFEEGNANFEQIVNNPHRPGQK
jgi:hypothetical protein